jgi:hypothetical protein
MRQKRRTLKNAITTTAAALLLLSIVRDVQNPLAVRGDYIASMAAVPALLFASGGVRLRGCPNEERAEFIDIFWSPRFHP